MSKIINVGRVTAYADAVKGGYQGTREEWERDLANLGTTAAEVEANRQAVAEDKAAVEGDVTTVGEYKDAAASSAAEAAQSAADAHTDALAATAAKEAAQTAQGSAVEAKEAAVSAKTSAENAQTEADQSARAAAGSALVAGEAAQTATARAGAASDSATAAAASAASAEESAAAAAEAARTLTIDTTLTQAGQAADAKEAGDGIDGLRTDYLSDVPSGYKRLEYLESTIGGNQYVSMGGTINNNTRIRCKFARAATDTGNVQYLLGGRTSASQNVKTIGFSATDRLIIGYYNSQKSYETIVADKDPHIVDYDKNKVYFDGTLVAEYTDTAFATPVRAVMFAVSGVNTTLLYYGAMRIYRCTVWDNDVLTHDFVPVFDIDNNRYGMYDLVADSFGRNPSATPLTSGGTIATYRNHDEITDLFVEVQKNADKITQLENTIDAKDYIRAEADRVAEKVRNVQTGTSISFVACSDLHYPVAVGSGDGVYVTEAQTALRDMRDGILEIAKQTHIDFYACFGDVIYQWQNHGANYNNGVAEMTAVTKLLNEAFGDNDQVRMVGNHDPNCENNDNNEFSAYLLNSYTGIYSDMLTRDPEQPYGAYGYHDFERQKMRLIVLNTSFFTPETDLTNGATRYYLGNDQAYWLCKTLDLSDKEDAAEWQIMICSHVVLDNSTQPELYKFTAILSAYEAGTTWSSSGYSYDFAGRNSADLALYVNGHAHKYSVKNMISRSSSGTVLATLPTANIYVPNALPGREEQSFDGVTYTKTAASDKSTAFQIITIDPVEKRIYAHHYGAGIDIILHYEPSTNGNLATALTTPAWSSVDNTIATVSNGVVTPVSNGYVMIYAKSDSDNTVEAWNYQSVI